MASLNLSAKSISFGLSIVLLTGTGIYVIWKRKKKPVDFNSLKWENVGVVSELNIYPVKSAGRVTVKSANVTKIGLHQGQFLDRGLVVVKEGNLLTGRECNILPTIKSSIESSSLTLTALDGSEISIDLDTLTGGENIKLSIHGEPAEGIDCGDIIADWLSNVLYPGIEKKVRLLYYICPTPWKRSVDNNIYFNFPNIKKDDEAIYQDTGTFQISSLSSLSELNSRLEKPVDMRRFRPNIVVGGSIPWDEDNWEYVRIGQEVILRAVKPCSRCVFITVDPDTGERRRDHYDELLKYRLVTHPESLATKWKQRPIFGIHSCPERTGDIHVGDTIQVSRSDSNYWRCKNNH